MNCYEHTLIAKHDLSESQNQKLVSKYEDIINKNLGKVLKTENWGLRTLAYKIKNNKKGFYFHIYQLVFDFDFLTSLVLL